MRSDTSNPSEVTAAVVSAQSAMDGIVSAIVEPASAVENLLKSREVPVLVSSNITDAELLTYLNSSATLSKNPLH